MGKIDLQIDKGAHGQFTRLVVQVNLANPLVSKIRIATRLHCLEYESLPSNCFSCGHFGHVKQACPHVSKGKDLVDDEGNMTNKMALRLNSTPCNVQTRVK